MAANLFALQPLPPRIRMARFLIVFLALLFAGLSNLSIADEPPLRWFKGNIHTHSLWSDGDDFPEMIADWYREKGYHFLALSDHNILSEGRKWIKESEIVKRGGKEALAKYRARFGGEWVETRLVPVTAPAKEGDKPVTEEALEVRLKPLSEFRTLVEERGRFLMIQGEEISDKAEGVPIHLNATNIQEVIQPLGGKTVREAIDANVRAVEDQAAKKGREIFVHLNHPNFGLAVTAEDMAELLSERFFEVYNGHPGVKHLGDATHPRVELLWDIANTIRLSNLKAPPLYGVANDDTHDYHGPAANANEARPGRGWVMVEARYLSPEHLIRSLKAARFYASSGVSLSGTSFDAQTGKLEIAIAGEPGVEYTTDFIGTPADYDRDSQPAVDKEGKPIRATRRYSADIGKTFATAKGLRPSYTLTGKELYIRAVVTSSRPHPDPTYKGQKEQAWTQPVGWEKWVKSVK